MNAMCRVILGVARQTDPLVVNFSVKLLVAFPEMKINDFFGFFKKSFLPSSWTFLHLYLCFTSYSLIITAQYKLSHQNYPLDEKYVNHNFLIEKLSI